MTEMLYTIDHIIAKRGSKRCQDTGALLFCVKWAGFDEEYNSWEPFQNFIELEEKSTTEQMIHIIKDYKKTALKFMYNYRKCLNCDRRVRHGNIFCCKKNCQEYNTHCIVTGIYT